VVTDLDGNFIAQIGSSGEEGLRDGSFDDATFNRPQVRILSVSCFSRYLLWRKNFLSTSLFTRPFMHFEISHLIFSLLCWIFMLNIVV